MCLYYDYLVFNMYFLVFDLYSLVFNWYSIIFNVYSVAARDTIQMIQRNTNESHENIILERFRTMFSLQHLKVIVFNSWSQFWKNLVPPERPTHLGVILGERDFIKI